MLWCVSRGISAGKPELPRSRPSQSAPFLRLLVLPAGLAEEAANEVSETAASITSCLRPEWPVSFTKTNPAPVFPALPNAFSSLVSGQQAPVPRGAGLLTLSSGVCLFILGVFSPLFLAGDGGEHDLLGATGHPGCSGLSHSMSLSSVRLLPRFGAALLQMPPLGPAPRAANGRAVVSDAFLSTECASSDETAFFFPAE